MDKINQFDLIQINTVTCFSIYSDALQSYMGEVVMADTTTKLPVHTEEKPAGYLER